MRLKKSLVLPLLILLICLPACAKNQSTAIQGTENPFAATGLLTHPNETAEEILMRAHAQDPEAMILTATGYLQGIGGFPKDERLASDWMFACTPDESYPYTVELFSLMFENSYAHYEAPKPGYCYRARLNFATPLLKQAGLFDLDSVCASVGYDNKNTGYDFESKNSELKKIVIELTNRPLNKQDADELKWALVPQNLLLEFLGHQIAMGSKKNTSKLEQRLNLLSFIAQRQTELIPSETKPFPESAQLHDLAVNTLARLNSETSYKTAALEIIHKAHQGDLSAVWQMAENYHNGAMGFPKNKYLGMSWLRQAAMAGDKRAVDTFALWAYMENSIYLAWDNAHIALLYGSPELKDEFTFIIKETEKQFSSKDLQYQQRMLKLNLERLEEEGYQTK